VSGEGLLSTVGVLTEVTALEHPFDYLVPDGFSGPLEVGSRVRVPLHGRSVRGWITGVPEAPRDATSLKDLRGSLGLGPPRAVLELARWAAWRWNGTWAHFAKTASPDTIVRALPARPSAPTLSTPATWLGALGAERARRLEPGVLELGPCTDPFDLVVGFLAALAHDGRLEDASALIVVPGVGYAGRLVRRLARRTIPAVEAASSWEASRAGWPVVVGTRTAAFAPCPSLGGVLVLDVDDERMGSEAAPTWRAPAVLLERAARERAPALFVASCAGAVEAQLGDVLRVAPSHERDGWPSVAIADRREEDPRHGVLSSHLVELARHALEHQPEGVAVACLVNRTGRARLLACARCDALLRCERCDAAMALDEGLHCSRCGASRPAICQACGATKLKLLRLGTAQLAPELEALLGVEVRELTASSKPEDWQGARAIVGTEAILHRLRHCSLVAFLDLDHHLLAPRVGAELRTLGLIGKAGRLVGGRAQEGAGLVLLQTRLAGHPVVVAAQRGDPRPVIDADASLRRDLALPPFRSLATVKGPGASDLVAQLSCEALEVAELGEQAFAVMAPSVTELADALAGLERPRARVVVSVDPESV
jgi:primosomal protein N' (replication factor Y)